MLPVTSHKRTRISNQLAAVAALLLILSSMSGVIDSHQTESSVAAHSVNLIGENEAGVSGLNLVDRAVRRTRGFRMSLFLFPRS